MTRRFRYQFGGIVQGVGFRPFLYRLARLHGLSGYVQNRPDGVVLEVEGPDESIETFLGDVHRQLPPLAEVTRLSSGEVPVRNDPGFQIIPSDSKGPRDLHITPDAAICAECLEEMFDPGDRRYRYPFINCTNCGPRLTIIRAIPYDRANTSMSCFPMCPECLREYEDPEDRRFHAEPDCCPVCGPRLSLLDAGGSPVNSSDPVRSACGMLRAGVVMAIKGLGGFHLCVDAGNDKAVGRLRSRKLREEKPLAVMVRNLEYARQIAWLSQAEIALLESPQRPIVLARKKNSRLLSGKIAPGVADLGLMLPYTPLHHLLFGEGFDALVMTSANRKDEPICIGNREAISRLKGIADFFLVHDRDILVRCDDSVAMAAVGKPILVRRSRGYVPQPIPLAQSYPEVLALGAHVKTTVCILKGELAFFSPHIGDMETPLARDFLRESIDLGCAIAQCRPKWVACDLHPGYHTSRAAAEMEGVERVIPVQHHHAHLVSCMAENGVSGKVIGIAMDGTGYGSDGTIWGGEFLVADEMGFVRTGHLSSFRLPGGEKAIHEPWRVAVSLLKKAFGENWPHFAMRLDAVPGECRCDTMDRAMDNGLNAPLTSSLGRFFDGVAAILGLRKKVAFEAQAAMELEAAADGQGGGILPFDIVRDKDRFLLDFSTTIRAIAESFLAGEAAGALSGAFHDTLIESFRRMAGLIREETGLDQVVLSGGCFQNRILLEGCIRELASAGFSVFFHRKIPANDGGISLGQAVCAGARLKKGRFFSADH